MSDLVPETPFDGIVRIVKLTNGDELIGIVRDDAQDKIKLVLPALVETAYSKDTENNLIEYVKLINYAANVKNYEITINRSSIMYTAMAIPELEKMYETFFHTMKTDPSSILKHDSTEIILGPEAGLQMLNELFNNEDFVNFVNDMIDSFEGENVLNEIIEDEGEDVSEDDNGPLFLPEASINDPKPEEAPRPPKKKKRKRVNPGTNDIPFNPEANPNSAEGWSDNPQDYL